MRRGLLLLLFGWSAAVAAQSNERSCIDTFARLNEVGGCISDEILPLQKRIADEGSRVLKGYAAIDRDDAVIRSLVDAFMRADANWRASRDEQCNLVIASVVARQVEPARESASVEASRAFYRCQRSEDERRIEFLQRL